MSMIERVARALCKLDGYDPDQDPNYVSENVMNDFNYPQDARKWHSYAQKARAAIAAMREPSEAMLEASNRGYDICPFPDGDPIRYAWREMIDEALK